MSRACASQTRSLSAPRRKPQTHSRRPNDSPDCCTCMLASRAISLVGASRLTATCDSIAPTAPIPLPSFHASVDTEQELVRSVPASKTRVRPSSDISEGGTHTKAPASGLVGASPCGDEGI